MGSINWKLVSRASAWILALTGLVAIYAFASRRQNDMVCRSIRIQMVDSERFVTSAQVWHELNTHHLINKKINLLEIDSLESRFRENPFIAQATLSVDLSGILQVKIGQKHPFILVTNGQGQRFFVDRQGNKMPWSSADTSQFFRVTGHIGESFGKSDTLHTATLKNILVLSAYLEKSPFRRSYYRNFAVNDQDEMELIPTRQPFTVLIGDTSSLDEKFSKLDLMYSTVFPKEGTDKYSIINLKYTGQMVCTLKDKPAAVIKTTTKTQPADRLLSVLVKKHIKISPSLSYGK